MPPPADGFVARLVLGPALRAQPDGRLVTLVRDGYEAAFEEIVRRYGHPLRRYAAAIVGGSADDVTQDALSKAFLALRRDDREVELRPWLYRIVRNTALNDLRDRPPQGSELHERIAGRSGVAEEVERRAEVEELLGRLRALPEPQRAAIVMRELEGLGHEEIAAALGISGGAARQAIHRARTALRDGFGMAIPLPLLKLMLEGGTTAEVAAGGAGAGVVLKAATATVLVAGTLGAGLAMHDGHSGTKAAGDAASGSGPQQPGRLAATSAGTVRTAFHQASEAKEGGLPGRDHSGRSGGSGSNRGDQPGGSTHSGAHDTSENGSGARSGGDGSDSSGGAAGDGKSGGGSGGGGETSGELGDSGSGSSDGFNGDGHDGGEISASGGGSESNSSPDSGGEGGPLGVESDGSRDSGGGSVSSEQMEVQTTEEER